MLINGPDAFGIWSPFSRPLSSPNVTLVRADSAVRKLKEAGSDGEAGEPDEAPSVKSHSDDRRDGTAQTRTQE